MSHADTILWGLVVVTSVAIGLAPVFVCLANLAAAPVAAAAGAVLAVLAGSVAALRWREGRRQRAANAEALARRPRMHLPEMQP